MAAAAWPRSHPGRQFLFLTAYGTKVFHDQSADRVARDPAVGQPGAERGNDRIPRRTDEFGQLGLREVDPVIPSSRWQESLESLEESCWDPLVGQPVPEIFRFAKPRDRVTKQSLDEPVVAGETQKRFSRYGVHDRVVHSQAGRAPVLPVENRQFAEEVTWTAQGQDRALAIRVRQGCHGMTGLEREHMGPGIALAEQHGLCPMPARRSEPTEGLPQ